MGDDFLHEAGLVWRAEPADIARMRLQLRGKRWAMHRALTVQLIGGCVAFLFGVFFFAMAVKTNQWLFTLSAIALLVGMPLSMSANLRAHRAGQRWEDETPEGVVLTTLARAETSLTTVRIGRWGVFAIGAFVALLWLGQATGTVKAAGFLALYTATAGIICVPYLLYLRRRERRAGQERAACRLLLDELRAGAGAKTGGGND